MKFTSRLFVRASEMFWFAAVVGFLLLMGEVIDEVRHGHENLMIGFAIPLWGFAVLFSTLVSRSMQTTFPALSPRNIVPERNNWSVIIAVGLALTLGVIWGKSALFAHFYDSCKIILAMQLAGLLLGFIYKTGGLRNLLVSLFFALVAAVAACGGLLVIVYAMSSDDSPNIMEIARALTSIGVPLATLMALLDYLRQAQSVSKGFISPSMLAR